MGKAMANFSERTIWTGDNLEIMRGINCSSVDLIYLDPPFNSNRNYAAPVGSAAAGAAFKDTWTLCDLDVAWMGLVADQQPDMPVHDGRAPTGNAPGAEGDRLHLSTLRPHRQPLPQIADGQHLWAPQLSQ